ncbi:MAG: DUF1571 domain-containing protein [Bacteroidales bacterium]
MKYLLQTILLFLFQASIFSQKQDSLLKAKALNLMKLAQAEYLKINDYEATIISTERIDGKLRDTEYIKNRYMNPGYIYLKWLPGPFEGMQASYNPKRDKPGEFMGKESGIKGIIGVKTWNNNDRLIKLLYPHHFTIHQTNLSYFMETMQMTVDKALRINKLNVTKIEDIKDKYTLKPATSVMVILSSNPSDGLKWLKVALFFDHSTKLPLHFILYDFSGNLFVESAFTNFRQNIGLKANDFEIN